MRKKKGLSIVKRAIIAVPEFENVQKRLAQQVVLRGQSQSTLNNPITKRNSDLQFVPEEKTTVETLINPQKEESRAERIIRLTGFDSGQCAKCKNGRMLAVEEIPRIRSPAAHLPTLLWQILC